jgi:hypothetical protein
MNWNHDDRRKKSKVVRFPKRVFKKKCTQNKAAAAALANKTSPSQLRTIRIRKTPVPQGNAKMMDLIPLAA